MTETQSKAIVPVKQHVSRYTQDRNWQRAWLEIEAIAWRTLAFIPMDKGSSLDAVHGLAAIAWQQRGHSVVVADIRAITLPALSAVRDELRRRISNSERVLIASRSLSENPVAATIARESDGVILCIALGMTKRESVADSIREIGKSRIIGTISLKMGGA